MGSGVPGLGPGLRVDGLEDPFGEFSGGTDVFVGVVVAGPVDMAQEFDDVGHPRFDHCCLDVGVDQVTHDRLGLADPPAGLALDGQRLGRLEVFVEFCD